MESTPKFIKRKLSDLGSAVYRNIIFPFVKMGIERKTDSIIGKGAYLRGGTTLSGRAHIGDGAYLDHVEVGYSTMIGNNAIIGNTKIGHYSCIGDIHTLIGRHPVKGESIAIHPAFFSKEAQFGYTYVDKTSFEEAGWSDRENGFNITIGNDVWVGYSVSICDGVTIGDGAVVGAGSLVVKDIEPYAIYAGVPAKKIGERFDKETADRLLELRWWDKDKAWIEQHAGLFTDPEAFLDSVKRDGSF